MDEAELDDALLTRLFTAADKHEAVTLSGEDNDRLTDIIAMLELQIATLYAANNSLARAMTDDPEVLH